MGALKVAAAALGLMIGTLAAAPASAWNRGNVQVLTVLPDLIGQPPGTKSSVEGLTVGLDGNIYVSTFGFNSTPPGAISGPAVLFVISPNGKIVRQVPITCPIGPSPACPVSASAHMLGLRFNPVTKALWVLDFGAGMVLSVDPSTGNSSLLAGPIAGSGLNALTFDAAGNGYVSDSFNGAIWKISSGGGTPSTPWISDPLLGPGTGLTPPFGANGVEFSNDGKTLFVANTAFHQIIQIPVTTSGGVLTPGKPSIFVTGINAPDGIAIDSNDNIWICANQEDEIVVIDNTGKVIAKLGDFEGIDPKGIVRGLLFPASLAFSNDKSILYVSNLTLFLPFAGAHLAIDSAWTLQVQGYTVSKLPAKIPPIAGD
jgi:DNA-binding beta-propeller fold protein YncE